MKKRARYMVLIIVTISALAGAWAALRERRPWVENAVSISRPARIRPDYSGTVIPPNIAPLNFAIREPGTRFLVRIHCEADEAIEIFGKSPKITIPLRRWRSLLSANRGKKLFIDVYVEAESERWHRYETIVHTIAKDQIDGYIAYRLMKPLYNKWRRIGIYQRDLSTYREWPLLDGMSFDEGCVNCHSFVNNSPERMFVSTRSSTFGSAAILVDGGEVRKIGTKFGYTAWHPSGRLAAYSINKVTQFFHAAGPEVRDVIDLDAALAYYIVEARNIKMISRASDKQRLETYPTWSPDGRYLYYCSAPILWADRDAVPPKRYTDVKYDLMRIRYDINTDKWGKGETVLSAKETGLSILTPRISPDGRFLLFCMCRYGCFPIYQPSSDLYMMDLATGKYWKLAVNSEFSESWHSWSSNGRWIAFSSKRPEGTFTRCYISFVDKAGKAHKPFILPQKDPAFYDSFLKTYSVPELITGPVEITNKALARAARSQSTIQVDSITAATPKASGAGASEPWQHGGR